MHVLRRSTCLARLVAGWVVLWFAAMVLAPFASAQADCDAAAVHAGHEGHALAACDGEPAADMHAAHAERASGAGPHCPVCLHVAAPPPALALAAPGHAAPDVAAARASTEPARVHSATPPPPRGPPRLS